MIDHIVIPEFDATGGDVKIVEWLVKEGDKIEAGQPIFSVETDKAVIEVEAFRGGCIRKILAAIDTKMAPGTAVAVIADNATEPIDAAPQPAPEKSKNPGGTAPLIANPAQPTTPTLPAGRVMASPLAKATATTLGINLSSLQGTGLGGHIRQADVIKAAGGASTPGAELTGMKAVRTPVSPMRKAIAERTLFSKTHAPHFYVSTDIDMAKADEVRREATALAESKGWPKPTVTALVMRAVALALRKIPQINASYQDETIVTYGRINLGLVIGADDGMMAPVIHGADEKDIYALADAIRGLQARVKSGELSRNDMTGSTLTISNLGMYGIDNFIAVINPPEAAILALGAIRPKPVVADGQVVPRPVMTVTLSADHRAVDGIAAAKFLKCLKDLLENPLELAARQPKG